MKIRRPDMLLLAVVLFIALIVFLQIREGFEAKPYDNGITYKVGDVVTQNGKTYEMIKTVGGAGYGPGLTEYWKEIPNSPAPVPNPAVETAPPPIDIKPALPTVAPMKPIPSNAMPLNPLAPTPPGVAGTVTPMQGSPAPVEATPGTVAPTVVLPVAAGPGTYMLRQVF